jgi:hypothetical protein
MLFGLSKHTIMPKEICYGEFACCRYYRQGQQGGYDSYQSQQSGNYSNGANQSDYSYGQEMSGQSEYSQNSASAYGGGSDPYNQYSQMPGN